MVAETIAQAIYTWAPKLVDRREGFGFLAVSPSLRGRMPWLEETTKKLTGFVGKAAAATTETASYVAIGRSVVDNQTVAYRKVDAGRDSHGREGRYLIHFLSAGAADLPLSAVLRIGSQTWLHAQNVPLGIVPELQDLTPRAVISPAQSFEVSDADADRVRRGTEILIRQGFLEAGDWSTEHFRMMIACLPRWCDSAMVLTPKWTRYGASVRLSLGEAGASLPVTDPDVVLHWDLEDLRQMLSTARTFSELQQLVLSPTRPVVRSDDLPGTGDALSDALHIWLARGSRALSLKQDRLLRADPRRTVQTMHDIGRRLPATRRVDDLAIYLLRECEGVEDHVLEGVMPVSDEAIDQYLASVVTLQILRVVLNMNGTRHHHIEIPVARRFPHTLISDLVNATRLSDELFRGLCRTLRLSLEKSGDFAGAVMCARGVDYSFLFARVIPVSAGGRPEVLMRFARLNPAEFVRWLAIGSPYADALVLDLRRDVRPDLRQRIAGFLSR